MFFTDKVTYRRIHIENSLVANSVCCSGRIRIKNGAIKSLKNKLSNMHKKHRAKTAEPIETMVGLWTQRTMY